MTIFVQNVHFEYMKTISTTEARKHIKSLVEHVRETGDVIVIGRRERREAILIKFPDLYNSDLSNITNINTFSSSFDFLEEEPDLYSVSDLKKKYV